MDCEKFQKEYLLYFDASDKAVSYDLEQHLNQCAECRRFIRVLEMLRQCPEPSAALDRRVLADFRMLSRKRRKRRLAAEVLLALAASVLLLCSLAVLQHPENRKPASVDTVAVGGQPQKIQADWERQLTDTETELENLELEMSFLLTGL